MHHLGMELDTIEFALLVRHCSGRGISGVGDRAEAVRHLLDAVAMAHPDCRLPAFAYAREQTFILMHVQFGPAVLPLGRLCDLAAKNMGQELHAVADPEHGYTQLQVGLVDKRRSGVIHARRASGQDQALRFEGLDLFEARVVRKDLAVDPGFTNAAGDQLGVLGAEIEDQYSFTVDIGHGKPLS